MGTVYDVVFIVAVVLGVDLPMYALRCPVVQDAATRFMQGHEINGYWNELWWIEDYPGYSRYNPAVIRYVWLDSYTLPYCVEARRYRGWTTERLSYEISRTEDEYDRVLGLRVLYPRYADRLSIALDSIAKRDAALRTLYSLGVDQYTSRCRLSYLRNLLGDADYYSGVIPELELP